MEAQTEVGIVSLFNDVRDVQFNLKIMEFGLRDRTNCADIHLRGNI